jgi:hypothetical protein
MYVGTGGVSFRRRYIVHQADGVVYEEKTYSRHIDRGGNHGWPGLIAGDFPLVFTANPCWVHCNTHSFM